MGLFNRKRKQQKAFEPICWRTPQASYYDVSDIPLTAEHTLIAGATGCGKSTFLHSVMQAALAQYSPSEARFILIDPKAVELMRYEHLPHTLRYADTEEKCLSALDFAQVIMARRYAKMKELDVEMWTTKFGPIVYVIIEEMSDLMVCPSKAKIKVAIQRLTQKGRAAGIHCICCSQSPARKILPAEITLNFTAKIALACDTAIESRQVIGINGAENLPDHGECILKYKRKVEHYEIPFVQKAEVMELVRYWQSSACRVA